MELIRAKAYLDGRLVAGEFDTYAVMAGFDDGTGRDRDAAVITSPGTDTDTLFDIASMGKVLVTATLLLHTFPTGRITPDGTLPQYLDGVPTDKRDITIRQLMTHTSGILRREIPDAVIAGGREAIIRHMLAAPLGFAPGTQCVYSCWGYLLLGYILELVYGETLDLLFYRYIKGPLGLTRADFNIPLDTPNAAVTHYRAEPGDCLVADSIVYQLKGVAGNGASFWTLADIRRFVSAVMAKNPLLYPQAYFAQAETDYTPEFEEGRGLGWLIVDGRYSQTGRLFPVGSFGHCGNTGTSFFMNRESGLYVIALTNATRFSYMRRGFRTCDYSETMRMREALHNAIREDLEEQGCGTVCAEKGR